MAIDEFLRRDTDAFVLPSPRSYYPLKIKIAHYQLRHFISSPEQDILYYASGHDIYCLNAATKTQAHIATLTFEARCTAAGHGYVCVGGAELGDFAAIRVAGPDPADVDALLPLDLPARPTVPRPPLLGVSRDLQYQRIGEDIVNSISIHRYPADADDDEDIVAVLTNNDKTVRVYSLTHRLELICLDFPFAMNHATISPDGQLLMAVGDEHHGFFFQRNRPEKHKYTKGMDKRVHSDTQEWSLLQEVSLYVPVGSCIRGYFSTAWSPSGSLCAVGSESGYITIFDVELLNQCEYGEDAIVQCFGSTRPDVTPGAVRTMQFSPAPWDFLIWSEDQARVCVADVRSGLRTKQTLQLNPEEESLERMHIADLEVNDVRQEYRRALDAEGTTAAADFAHEYMDTSSERNRLHRSLGVGESNDDPHGPIARHERQRQILEALRTTRQREGARQSPVTPRSINYTSTSAQARRLGEAAIQRVNMGPALSDFVNMGPALSDFARQLQQLSERNGAMPRRQASVLGTLDPEVSTGAAHTNITGGAMTRSPNPVPAVTHRDNSELIASTDDAWRTIEEALVRNARATDSARTSTAPELREEYRRMRQARQLTQMRERLRTAREARIPPDDGSLSSYRRTSRAYHDPADGVRTAGLAMSPDGGTLYCGSEEGIFEFKINMHPRKAFPATSPR